MTTFSNRSLLLRTEQVTQVNALSSMALNMLSNKEHPGYVLVLLRDASGHSYSIATGVVRNSTALRAHVEETFAPSEGRWEPHHVAGYPHQDPADCWWSRCTHYV